jgi:hypothetical protein
LYGWACQPLRDDDRVQIHTGRMLADSEPLSLLARVREDSLLVSDGGNTLARLADNGLDRADPVLDALWREALEAYRVQEVDGRVFLQVPLDQAAHGLNRFADAIVALDGLRVATLPARSRPRTLAAEVEEYLRNLYGTRHVQKSPTIPLVGGLTIKPALRVDTPSRSGVLVQTGAATSTTQSYDHAYAMFSLAERGRVPMPQRLVVLGGTVSSWNQARLRALAEVTFVGFWGHLERVREFLDGRPPDDPLMLPAGVEVPLLPRVPQG